MKNDSKVPNVARVEVNKVKFRKPDSLGIDFANEIDLWAKMEFKFRNKSSSAPGMMHDLNSIYYAFREEID